MEPFTLISSHYVSLPIKNVDTDMIIPAQYLTSVSREGYGKNLFTRMKEDPTFPLNDPAAKSAKILVVDENFGCGSSREHAVWAIMDAGYRVILGKSFADIFASNSGKNGLLLATLPEEVIDSLMKVGHVSKNAISVDLESQTVTLGDNASINFEYDPFRKLCLLNGLDDLDYIKQYENEIAAFRQNQERTRFYKTTAANNSR